MNYLAHLYLSPKDKESQVGNLMGDFIKGRDYLKYSNKIQQGILLHRAIDKFTDNHTVVRELKLHLSPARKRFSGILSDIVFDHFLALKWQDFSPISLSSFTESTYKTLNGHIDLMPEKMQVMVQRMMAQNWLESYQELSSIAGAINGVSRRIRFENHLLGAIDEVEENYEKYHQAFDVFFPELISFVSNINCGKKN